MNEQAKYTKSRGESWSKQRLKALNRDNHTCQKCDTVKSELELPIDVHHIIPYRNFDDSSEANCVENLISLCRSCHMKVERGGFKIDKTGKELSVVSE